MNKIAPITYDRFFHIFNCGINGESLFREADNYKHFLRLYEKYIDLVAETYAWCLMNNHFHLLVKTKEEDEIGFFKPLNADSSLNTDRSGDSVRFKTTTDLSDLSEFAEPDRVRKPNISKQFSHLFNAYSKYYNKKYNRHGSLFERPFKRKEIDSEEYFRQVIIYIHNNPVHHGFCQHTTEYPWSSYQTYVSVKPTRLQHETVIGWFDDVANFKYMHEQKVNIIEIEYSNADRFKH